MILKLKWYHELLKIVFKQQKAIKGAYIVKLIRMTSRYQSHDVMFKTLINTTLAYGKDFMLTTVHFFITVNDS
jgi:hypothetical protein